MFVKVYIIMSQKISNNLWQKLKTQTLFPDNCTTHIPGEQKKEMETKHIYYPKL